MNGSLLSLAHEPFFTTLFFSTLAENFHYRLHYPAIKPANSELFPPIIY